MFNFFSETFVFLLRDMLYSILTRAVKSILHEKSHPNSSPPSQEAALLTTISFSKAQFNITGDLHHHKLKTHIKHLLWQ